MTCDELKKMAQSGRLEASLAEPSVRAHLVQCAECDALYANPTLVRVLVAGAAAQSDPAKSDPTKSDSGKTSTFELGELAALSAELRASLQQEQGNPWNALRDRRTSVRRSVVLVAVVLMLGVCLLVSARADLFAYPLPRLVTELVLLFTIVGAAVWESTRTLSQPLTSGKGTAILTLCVVAPVVLALVSWLLPVTKSNGTSNLHHIGACMLWGTAVALPPALVLWLSKRANPWEEARVPLLAATLGVVGNLLLQVHCPSTEFVHLMSAHAPLFVVFALVFSMWGRVFGTKAGKRRS